MLSLTKAGVGYQREGMRGTHGDLGSDQLRWLRSLLCCLRVM